LVIMLRAGTCVADGGGALIMSGMIGNMTVSFPAIASTDALLSRAQIMANPSSVPKAWGIYGWWFRELPPLIDASA
jgi:hypothetical protein